MAALQLVATLFGMDKSVNSLFSNIDTFIRNETVLSKCIFLPARYKSSNEILQTYILRNKQIIKQSAGFVKVQSNFDS